MRVHSFLELMLLATSHDLGFLSGFGDDMSVDKVAASNSFHGSHMGGCQNYGPLLGPLTIGAVLH